MKTFAKRAALTTGLLFTALICCGIVYIDNIKHYWQFSGGFVRLVVNTNGQAIITVDTNTLSVGVNSNNTVRSLVVQGRQPATNTTGNGTSAATSGEIAIVGGTGGQTLATTSANGGAGGTITINGGAGVIPASTTTNATGGVGGTINMTGGTGGTGAQVATNAATGGNGGNFNLTGGAGGVPSGTASTNTMGGRGGALNFSGGVGGFPTVGWSRKGGDGGDVAFQATAGRNSTRTNGGLGGIITFTSGNGGNAATSGNGGLAGNVSFIVGNGGAGAGGGNPEPGGNLNLAAGNGNTGATNSNGGSIYAVPGAGGAGALPGDLVVARDSAGNSRGGMMVGPATANAASLTNLLISAATSLNFPEVGAQTETNLSIAVVGAEVGDIPTLGFTNDLPGGTFDVRCSNGAVHVRFINYSAAPINPPDSTFRVKVEKFR